MTAQTTPAMQQFEHQIDRDWAEYHGGFFEGEKVPDVSADFERAWQMQQARVEELTRQCRVLRSGIATAKRVLQTSHPLGGPALQLLTTIEMITEDKDDIS